VPRPKTRETPQEPFSLDSCPGNGKKGLEDRKADRDIETDMEGKRAIHWETRQECRLTILPMGIAKKR